MRTCVLFTILFFSSSAVAKIAPGEKYSLALYKSYIRMIQNSIGTRAYRTLYYKVGENNFDVLGRGNLSCAYFVSSILHHFDLLPNIHISIGELREEMKATGWYEIDKKKIKVGSVIVWSAKCFRGACHGHIGFYLGRGWAVSTSSSKGVVARHYYRKLGPRDRRIIKQVFWHNNLN